MQVENDQYNDHVSIEVEIDQFDKLLHKVAQLLAHGERVHVIADQLAIRAVDFAGKRNPTAQVLAVVLHREVRSDTSFLGVLNHPLVAVGGKKGHQLAEQELHRGSRFGFLS